MYCAANVMEKKVKEFEKRETEWQIKKTAMMEKLQQGQANKKDLQNKNAQLEKRLQGTEARLKYATGELLNERNKNKKLQGQRDTFELKTKELQSSMNTKMNDLKKEQQLIIAEMEESALKTQQKLTAVIDHLKSILGKNQTEVNMMRKQKDVLEETAREHRINEYVLQQYIDLKDAALKEKTHLALTLQRENICVNTLNAAEQNHIDRMMKSITSQQDEIENLKVSNTQMKFEMKEVRDKDEAQLCNTRQLNAQLTDYKMDLRAQETITTQQRDRIDELEKLVQKHKKEEERVKKLDRSLIKKVSNFNMVIKACLAVTDLRTMKAKLMALDDYLNREEGNNCTQEEEHRKQVLDGISKVKDRQFKRLQQRLDRAEIKNWKDSLLFDDSLRRQKLRVGALEHELREKRALLAEPDLTKAKPKVECWRRKEQNKVREPGRDPLLVKYPTAKRTTNELTKEDMNRFGKMLLTVKPCRFFHRKVK
ncbi:uncharacterized protein LOC142996529 [Genypterus blacodes]|uniref:uncharacterized protein LOC142996529 n=1 Tax=Genypterus blacodes TaxID=154954 RepID=UPI003F77159C